VRELAARHELVVTVEEHQIMGGAGSAVLEALADTGVKTLLLGLPDRFIEHGDSAKLLSAIGLDAEGIRKSIRNVIPE
jgi:1-deoxy-D-xylulose-5-phosphate synthase